MKRITIITSLLLTLFVTNANAQAKKPVVDSNATTISGSVTPKVADNDTPLLTINDLSRIDSLLQRKFTVAQTREYQEILAFMQNIVTPRVNQYNAINKSAAKKP